MMGYQYFMKFSGSSLICVGNVDSGKQVDGGYSALKTPITMNSAALGSGRPRGGFNEKCSTSLPRRAGALRRGTLTFFGIVSYPLEIAKSQIFF